MNKQEIIDLLISNEPLVHNIIKKTNEQIKDVEVEFMDEANRQQFEEVKRQVMNELSKSMGLTLLDMESNIDNEELEKFFNEVKKYE